jgi:acyl-CoA synthetase (AMP-forming)/AMP-acid ligase II/acyl carrier protein
MGAIISDDTSFPDNVRISHESIPKAIKYWAEKNTDSIAILAPGRMALTYGRLWKQIEDIGKVLNLMGVGRNDRVALVMPDGPEFAVAILAVGSCACIAPLGTTLSADEFNKALADLRISALVVQSDLDSPIREVARAGSIRIFDLVPSSNAEAGIFTLSGDKAIPMSNIGLAEPDDIFEISRTSGTTGHPKVAAHTHRSICTRAHLWDLALQLSETDRCLNLMPLNYGAGLMNGLLATLLAGGSVVCPPGLLQSHFSFFKWMELFRPTRYIGSANIHRAILDQSEANSDIISSHSLRFIGATSATLPPGVMQALEAVFNVPVIDMYSSTECGPVAVSPFPPARCKAGSVGVPVGGEVAIMDEDGTFLPSGGIGEIVVRGPAVFEGYENDPEANKQSFACGWYRMGDLGYMDGDGYLFLTGRLKEIINSGGQKISPFEVNQALLGHPAIIEAETFALPHPRLGEEVAAVVILNDGATISEREIREFLAERLARFKVPRRVLIVDEIPKNPGGKVQRHKLSEWFGKAAGLASEILPDYVSPRTLLEEELVQIWEKILGVEKIGVKDDFLSLGGDSIQATLIMNQLRTLYGISMPLGKLLLDASTIAQLAEVIVGIESGGGIQAFACDSAP